MGFNLTTNPGSNAGSNIQMKTSSYIDHFENLANFLYYLSKNPCSKATDLSEACGVHRATIYRYIYVLKIFGVVVEQVKTTTAKKSGYIIVNYGVFSKSKLSKYVSERKFGNMKKGEN